VRIAVHHTSEVGVRAGRILLAEREVTMVGVVDRDVRPPDDRLERITDLAGYDVIGSDDPAPRRRVEAALAAGIDCVLWIDAADLTEAYGDEFTRRGLTLLRGCNLGSGIAPALASHEMARADGALDTTIAWTEPGTPLRRGEAIPFPDPVGARWAKARSTPAADRAFVARVNDEWAGAMARITAAGDDGVVTRIVGVADVAPHLEALALAAGLLAVESYPPGPQWPGAAAEAYLTRALTAGLTVASYAMTTEV
jgi:hypothetical protein